MSREVVVTPLGLKTRPNRYGQYPAGALQYMRNVAMRDPGIISSLPARKSYRASVLGAGYTIRRLFPMSANTLVLGDNAGTWKASWVTGAAETAIGLTPTSYGSPATFDIGKAQQSQSRGRTILTSTTGVLALDSEGVTSNVRASGFPAPWINAAVSVAADPTSFLDGKSAAWRAVWRRVYSDGYEITSEPSQPIMLWNASGATVDMLITWILGSAGCDVQAGDFLDIYRTLQVTGGSDPGATFYLVQSHAVTAGEIAATLVTVRDRTIEASLGEELYTNPGRPVPAIVGVGGSYANSPPPKSTDTWAWKGRTFYVASEVASFVEFKITTQYGRLTSVAERTTGIGTRIAHGTSAIGSPTITGVTSTVGIVAGQVLDDGVGQFPAGVIKVLSKTVNSVTFDTNATGAATADFIVGDVWEVNGQTRHIGYATGLFNNVGTFVTLADQTINFAKIVAGPTYDLSYSVSGPTFTLRSARTQNGAITIRATNGANYSPPLPEITASVQTGNVDARGNRIQWSKDQQPEAVPPQQELFAGLGTIYRGIPTRDCVWLWCSDGLRRMSGSEDNWRVDDTDLNLVLAARNAVSVLNDTVYAYTNRGWVALSPMGQVTEFARDDIGDQIPGAAYADTWDTFIACDALHREAWLGFVSGTTLCYVYSELSKSFTTVQDGGWNALEYAAYRRSLAVGVIGAGGTAPSVFEFEADASTTRMSGASFDFQPLTGGSPFTQKQWTSLDLLFEGITTPLVASDVRFGQVGYFGPVTVASAQLIQESRSTLGIPRNVAIGNSLAPGFALGTGSTNQLWTLRGISTQYSYLTDDSVSRA